MKSKKELDKIICSNADLVWEICQRKLRFGGNCLEESSRGQAHLVLGENIRILGWRTWRVEKHSLV